MRVSRPKSSAPFVFNVVLSEERRASLFGLGKSWGMLSGPCVFYDAEGHSATICSLFFVFYKRCGAQMKTRLDKLLVERGLVPSRERAQALILAGRVLVDEQKIEKPGSSVEDTSALRLLGEDIRYVSRGGLKLEEALSHWQIDLAGKF